MAQLERKLASPQVSNRFSLLLRGIILVLIVIGFLIIYRLFWYCGREPLVVYCAHDSIYSEKVLKEFERRTGISVSVRFDTEATKSLGLVELLVREKDHPRCDVFWNNEVLGTLYLQDEGILQPYKGAGFERIPPQFKDPDGHWVGFGARLRVYIINTNLLSPVEAAVNKALQGDLSRVAIAKPLYGTTFTHYTVLWHLWGEDKLKAWHTDWRRRGVREVLGNATVKSLVAEGVCCLGLTDSDDFFVAKDEGKQVAMLPCRLENGSVICIPNTVAIVKGSRHLEEAKKLVDYLLGEECEESLANSRSRQVPLGPVAPERISEEVRELKRWAEAAYPLFALKNARSACLNWLKSEYLK